MQRPSPPRADVRRASLPLVWAKPLKLPTRRLDEALLAALRRRRTDTSVLPGVPFH